MRRLAECILLALAATLALAAACTTTAGVPITLTLAIEPLSDGRATTPRGWAVELTEAFVLLGPIYAYAPTDEPTALRLPLRVPLGPARARAHGGFDPLDGRLVRAEWIDQIAFDALGARVELGSIDGLLGAVDELSVILDSPRGPNADPSGPTRVHHVRLAGTATREGVVVAFEGELDLEDEGLVRRVDGISVEGPALGDGSTLVLGVDPARWLAEADFEGLASPARLDPSTQPHRALRLGVRSPGAYAARVEE